MTSARMQYGSQLYLLPIRDRNIVLWDFAPLFLFSHFRSKRDISKFSLCRGRGFSRVLPTGHAWSCLFGLLVRSSLSSAPGVALPVCQTRVPWSFYRMVQYPLSGYSQSLGSCSQHVRAWMHGIMGMCIKVGCQAN